MKKAVTTLLSLVLLLTCFAPGALAAGGVSVVVDGERVVWTDAAPFVNRDGRTMVPLRAVADAMGLDVSWDSATRTASFSQSGITYDERSTWTSTIHFPIDSQTARTEMAYNWVDREDEAIRDTLSMDTAAVIVNNRTYAPVRYLAEHFNWAVGWNGDTQVVTITDTSTFVYPVYYGGVNLLKGTWEVNSNNWTPESLRKIGIAQDTVHLIFEPVDRMAYQVFDTVYEGTYMLNTQSGGENAIDAVAILENGWVLNITILNMVMDVSGLPSVTRAFPSGLQTTDTWDFYQISDDASIGLDPWLQ